MMGSSRKGMCRGKVGEGCIVKESLLRRPYMSIRGSGGE